MNSYTQHILGKMKTAKEQVMILMAWTEIQYSDYQYKMGCQYLQAYIPNSPAEIDELIVSRIFWNWWKNEWLLRDLVFIGSDISRCKQLTIQQVYLSSNDAQVLVYEIYPNGVVLNSRYAEMIGNVQKEKAC